MFSIVIPAYNRSRLLLRTIASIEKLRSLDLVKEIIIVDDGSTEQFTELPMDVKVVRHEQNLGVVSARITGLLTANSEFVIFIDSDDLFEENALLAIKNCIIQKEGFEAYFFPPVCYANGSTSFEVCSVAEYSNFIDTPSRSSDYVMVLRRSDKLRRFLATSFYRCWELWFFVSFYSSNFRGYYSDIKVYQYIQHNEPQLSKNAKLRFRLGTYERKSNEFSIQSFIELTKVHTNQRNIMAWRRRLLKECILSFNFRKIWKLIF